MSLSSSVRHVNGRATAIDVYRSDRINQVHEESNLPFLISPEPFKCPRELDVNGLGELVTKFVRETRSLVFGMDRNDKWRKTLEDGKPEWMLDIV